MQRGSWRWRSLSSISGISCTLANSKPWRVVWLERRVNFQPYHPARHTSCWVCQIRALVPALGMKTAILYTTATLDSHHHTGALTIQQQHSGFCFPYPKFEVFSSPLQERIRANDFPSVVTLLWESLFGLFCLQSFNGLPLFMAPAREVISQGKKMRRWAIFQWVLEKLMLLLSQALSHLYTHV